MAKKPVGRVQKGSKRLTKAVKMTKSAKTGAYTFKEKIVQPDDVDAYFKSF